jgi:putative iron-regulated protein
VYFKFMRLSDVMLAGSLLTSVVACGGGEGGLDAEVAIAAYADHAEAGYGDALEGAEALRDALEAFVAAPDETTLGDARDAWVAARLPYRTTEALRFYGGPIDAPDDEREGQINAWPLDEASIDYVEGDATAGAINDPIGFPAITAEAILAANFQNGESDVKVGYHAIEFLLWGQDHSDTGPGERPATDYLTAANQDRRGDYLLAAADILVDDLTHVHDGWAGAYRDEFVAATDEEALRRILTGMGTLAASELSGERMLTAYENKDQEDEHSCFSDTTLDDLAGNALGIDQVYRTGLDDLVADRDAALAAEMDTRLAAMLDAIDAIPGPFDQAIQGEDSDPGRTAVLAAVRAIQAVGDTVVEIATLLGIEINTDL